MRRSKSRRDTKAQYHGHHRCEYMVRPGLSVIPLRPPNNSGFPLPLLSAYPLAGPVNLSASPLCDSTYPGGKCGAGADGTSPFTVCAVFVVAVAFVPLLRADVLLARLGFGAPPSSTSSMRRRGFGSRRLCRRAETALGGGGGVSVPFSFALAEATEAAAAAFLAAPRVEAAPVPAFALVPAPPETDGAGVITMSTLSFDSAGVWACPLVRLATSRALPFPLVARGGSGTGCGIVMGVEAAEKVPIVGSWCSFALPLGLTTLVAFEDEVEVEAAGGGGGVTAVETIRGDGTAVMGANSASMISLSFAIRRSNASVTPSGIGIVSAQRNVKVNITSAASTINSLRTFQERQVWSFLNGRGCSASE